MSSFLPPSLTPFLSLLRSYARRHVSRPRALLSLPEGGGGWHDAPASAEAARQREDDRCHGCKIDDGLIARSDFSIVSRRRRRWKTRGAPRRPRPGSHASEQAVASAGVRRVVAPSLRSSTQRPPRSLMCRGPKMAVPIVYPSFPVVPLHTWYAAKTSQSSSPSLSSMSSSSFLSLSFHSFAPRLFYSARPVSSFLQAVAASKAARPLAAAARARFAR